jgi:tight adherence protein C
MISEEIDHMIIMIISSLAAMLSFVAVAYPYLNRTEKKERYRSVIEKKTPRVVRASERGNGKGH